MNEAIKHDPPEDQKNRPQVFETVQDVSYTPATRWKRILAFFLDGVFVGLINLALGYVISAAGLNTSTIEGLIISQGFSVIVVYSYYVVPTYKYLATPGKKILGLKVINREQNSPTGILQLILREIPYKIVGSLLFMVGYLYFFFDREARALHDIWSKTIVVEEE